MSDDGRGGAAALDLPTAEWQFDTPTPGGPRRLRGRLILVTVVAVTIATGVGIFAPFVPEFIAALVIVNMICLLLLRVPLAVSTFVPSLLGLWALRSELLPITMLETLPFREVASWSLSVIPFYVLLGLVIARSGIAANLYRAVSVMIPWLPANLGVATTLAGSGLSTVSGSTISAVLAMARVGLPQMMRAGYDRRFAVGTVIVSGLSGPLIPPSIIAIVYAGIAQTQIGPQLMAGLVPGLLVIVTFTVCAVIAGMVRPQLAGGSRGADAPRPSITWTERWQALRGAWMLPLIVAIVVGGMQTGFFTATEAGAVATLAALVASVPMLRKERTIRPLLEAVGATVASTGAIFFMIMGAVALSQLVVISGLGALFIDSVAAWNLVGWQFLLIMVVVYLVLGTAMDTLPMMLVTVPVVLPILDTLAISPIWYGVFVIIMCELGMLTPPVGSLLYITHKTVQDPEVNLGHRITVGDVLQTTVVIIPVALVVVGILIFFPGIVLGV